MPQGRGGSLGPAGGPSAWPPGVKRERMLCGLAPGPRVPKLRLRLGLLSECCDRDVLAAGSGAQVFGPGQGGLHVKECDSGTDLCVRGV